jgi:hypothetical protein
VADTYLPAWAEFRLTEQPAEEQLRLEPLPASARPRAELPTEPPAIRFDQKMWNRAREAVEEGVEPGAPPAPPPGRRVGVSTTTAAPPEQPGLSVELPYESGLSISGRKLISLKLKETRRKSAKRAAELNVEKIQRDFEMKQELQVRIKGKVGRKITVNVDFDDTKEDKRDISVVYLGDPDEFVQEAAFGDITLSLPSTEFVSYSKQLFGVRTKLKYKRAELMAIGSRTKGITETKRFTGNTQFERKDIADTSYIRRRYYQLAFDTSHLPLSPGSEQVWLDNRVGTDNSPNTNTFTAEDFAVGASTYTGQFDLLRPGQDYTVDYARGIVNFRSALAQNAVVIVDYRRADGQLLSQQGTAGRMKLLKTENDAALKTDLEVGWRRELKTFYSIGRNRIVRDNGRGNFILKSIDLNRNDTSVALAGGGTLSYPSNVEVDFEAGTFNIAPPDSVADPTLYAPTPTHKFSYFLEYRFRLKTYLIRPNIVFQSERVVVNGRLLTRDIDYFIDYDSGFLTFFNDDEVDESSQIEVTYEFAPFGGQLGQTLVGARTELSLVPDKLFLGGTVLYTFAPKPSVVPDVRSAPSSLMVLEADSRLDEFKVPFLPLTASLNGEVAQSRENPNLFGRALVDSMEGIKQEEQAILDADFWQLASNPTGGGVTRPSAVTVADEDVKVTDISPGAQTNESDRQQVLAVGYTLGEKPGSPGTAERASLVHALSRSGRDFSKKLYMEVWVQGAGEAGRGVDLVVDAGQFNEDADGDGQLDTEDLNTDGSLNIGEDEGFNYNDPGADGLRGTGDDSLVRIGPGNGRIDTEDLDADGARDFTDTTPRAFPLFRLSQVPGSAAVKMIDPATQNEDPHGDLEFTGWRFVQIPLNVSASEEPAFQAIKQVRLTLVGDAAGAPRAGTVRIGKVSFVGNRWERALTVGGSTMTVSAVNNIDDPDYRSLIGNPAYEDLYQDETTGRLREQALKLEFDLPSPSSATTRVSFPTARDFSRHKSFYFFVQAPRGRSVGETFFLQLGSDTDYFEYVTPIDGQYSDSWVLEGARLVDLNDDSIPDVMEPIRGGAQIRVVGAPSLASVGQVKIGVRNATGAPISSELWVNEIHLSGSRLKVGNARRFSGDFQWDRWGSFGGSFREVDRNFQTLTSQITNQDRTEESAYLNFDRISFMPLSFTGSRSETVTPAAVRTGDAGLVSVLEEGNVETKQGSGKGQLSIPYLPTLGFGYDKSITDSNLLRRIDDKDVYTGDASYSLPWRPDFLPGRFFTLRPFPDSASVRYVRTNYLLSFYDVKKFEELNVSSGTAATRKNAIFANVRTLEYTDDWSGRASFAPWDGLAISPSYGRKRVRERRRFTRADLAEAPEFTDALEYDKSLSQNQGLTASWRLLRWLEPRVSYSLSGTETNVLPSVSTPTAFDFKTLDRSSDGDLSWTFTARSLLPNFRPTQSFSVNNSFRIEDGDTHDGVSKDFEDWQRIRTVQFTQAKRANGRPLLSVMPRLVFRNPEVVRKQLVLRNTFRSSGNWSPLDWIPFPTRLQPFKTLGITATVTNTDEHKEVTGTVSDSTTRIWPDLIFSMRETEKLYGLRRWMENSQLNVRTNRKKTEIFKTQFTQDRALNTDYRFTLFRRYDLYLTYGRTDTLDRNLVTNILNSRGEGFTHSYQVGATFGSWRLTPSAAYRTDKSADGAGKTLTDLDTRTYGFKTRLDKSYAGGFRLPFTRKILAKVNRLILDTGLTYETKKSSLNTERDNIDTYSLSTNGEYEIGQNFRLSFGGGGSLIKNRVKRDDGIMSYEVTSSLVIQF